MTIYAGIVFAALSMIYTLSYAKQSWKDNKAASIGAILIVFIAVLLVIIAKLRT